MHARLPRFLVPLLIAAASPLLHAEPLPGADELQRNGGVSRRVWQPEFATATAGGVKLSAGLALGLQDGVRQAVGRRFAPQLSLDLGGGASLSLLPAGASGAMLVLHATR